MPTGSLGLVSAEQLKAMEEDYGIEIVEVTPSQLEAYNNPPEFMQDYVQDPGAYTAPGWMKKSIAWKPLTPWQAEQSARQAEVYAETPPPPLTRQQRRAANRAARK